MSIRNWLERVVLISLIGDLFLPQAVQWGTVLGSVDQTRECEWIEREQRKSRSALQPISVTPASRSVPAPSFPATLAPHSAPLHPIFGPLRSHALDRTNVLRTQYKPVIGLLVYSVPYCRLSFRLCG